MGLNNGGRSVKTGVSGLTQGGHLEHPSPSGVPYQHASSPKPRASKTQYNRQQSGTRSKRKRYRTFSTMACPRSSRKHYAPLLLYRGTRSFISQRNLTETRTTPFGFRVWRKRETGWSFRLTPEYRGGRPQNAPGTNPGIPRFLW